MSNATISLDGDDWTIREALGDTAEWYLGAPLPEAGNNVAEASAAIAAAPGWLPARVPGAVIDDLHRAGEVPDPRVGRNSRAAEWVAERSWVYRRAVEVEASHAEGVGVLELDGVDPGADVYWDGELLGSIDGLYHRGRFALTAGQRSAGRHKLALRVHPAPDSEPQVGRTERVRVHTPRLGYGWDFSPRLRHQGVWKSARLRLGRALLGDVVVRSRLRAVPSSGESWSEFGASGEQMSPLEHGGGREGVVTASWEAAATGADATVTVRVARDGRAVAAVTVAAADGAAEVRIPHPELWWPNTVGGQPLYDVTLALADAEGEADVAVRTVGFRTAELVGNEDAPPGSLPYTAVVNGERVPLVGWNWTPADTLFGSIDERKVEHLLGLAAASGARLIRVWGGGLIETERFYATCDRLGLLVWQEFSQSSSGMQSAPSADPAFVALMRAEAETLIPTRVHHPSLLLWGGGNELDEAGVPLDDDRSPVLAALSETVARLDAGRGWLPTSPTGPESHNRLDRIQAAPEDQHDVHGPWEHQGLVRQYTLANAGTSLAHTEFGVEGMTNLRSLEALIPEADRWPADRTNPVYRHLGEWWDNADQVVALFGGRPDSLESLNRASQLLQATGLQYAVEADRRRFPRCSMVLPWQLNESFPNAWCTSAVDFRGDPKPAFFAVARAFQRRRVTLRVDRAIWAAERTASVQAWLWAEDPVTAGSTVTLRARALDGSIVMSREVTAAAVGDPHPAGELAIPVRELPAVFLWEAEWRDAGGVIDLERTLATSTADLGVLFDVPAAALDAVREADGTVVVRNTGTVAALTVRLVDARPAGQPGILSTGGDPRVLLPGEERRLTSSPGFPVRLDVWNAGRHTAYVHGVFRSGWCDSPVKTRIAEYPRPDHFLLHISDTHLLAGGERLYGSVDSEKHLRALLAEVEASGGRPEAIIFTGDLADRGQPDAYARLRALVEPAAERMGARIVWVMGNHDDRVSFRQGLRDELGDLSPVDDVYWFGGLRVIVLDSTVPGHHYGDVSESQLDWLAAELATAASEGTILAMHHPPIPSVLDLAVSVELRDQSQLREVLEGSDVRSILAGHLHYSSTAMFAGIPVSVASASCYTQDLNVPVGGTRGRDGAAAFNLVHVYPNTVLHSVVPLGQYPALDYVDAEESARRLAADGIRIPPAARRETPTTPITVLA